MVEATHQSFEIGAGVAPVKGLGGLLVAVLEAQQALLQFGEVGEVIRGQDLALDDREVDLG